jgi:hypothetical protein
MAKNKPSEIRKKIIQVYEENEYANLLQNKNRARSLNVGTAFGGIVEVSMRGDYHHLWCPLQPVEVVEVIEQLAASAGLQIAIRPRQDFATWRGWNANDETRYWLGSAPWQAPRMKEAVEEEAKLLESKDNKETKKLPQAKKKKDPKKKIVKILEETNEEINSIREDLVQTTQMLDEQRLENFEDEKHTSYNLKPAKEHIDNMRELILEEYENDMVEHKKTLKNISKRIRENQINEFVDLLDEKYSEN